MTATAAYPPELCKEMAAALFHSETDVGHSNGPVKAPT